MPSKCLFCSLASRKQPNQLFANKDMIALLEKNPANAGQVLLIPRHHCALLTQLPREIFAEMLLQAKRVSKALLKALHVEGTNLLIRVGADAGQQIAHASLSIIPRIDNDGIDLSIPDLAPGNACRICDMDRIYTMSAGEDIISYQFEGVEAIAVSPRQHFPILEQVPDQTLRLLSYKLLEAVETALIEWHADGAYIILHNGIPAQQIIPHFCLLVVPAKTDMQKFTLPVKTIEQKDNVEFKRMLIDALALTPESPKSHSNDKSTPTQDNLQQVSSTPDTHKSAFNKPKSNQLIDNYQRTP